MTPFLKGLSICFAIALLLVWVGSLLPWTVLATIFVVVISVGAVCMVLQVILQLFK